MQKTGKSFKYVSKTQYINTFSFFFFLIIQCIRSRHLNTKNIYFKWKKAEYLKIQK